ncbi:restriction endonuclease subunit S [Nitratireductor aquimarinus]|uniref:Restriction endonuclease subunit S n=1 Tax=Nitratireductor aquimarinus TaxID=889300 RepID=A0ABU4AHC1_9HYPH|nr:restriction endonuclease subunit S [Nitratireductor aquimarinus]MDV6225647.1 restriction endonuclease subunit S [Nitratireductor aquimarinus]
MITREIAQASLQAKPLGEVAEFLDSRRKPVKQADRKPGPYPYYGANGQQGTIDGFIFDEPLILLAEDGGFFDDPDRGIAYRIQGKSWVNNHAHVIKPKDGLDLSYLCRVLENYDVRPFINGSTRSKLTKTQASQIPIPVPTLYEQKRIAAILDQADALRRLRQRALDRINTLGQAIFHEMFGRSQSTELIELKTLGQVKTGSTPSTKVAEYFDGDIPFITPGDLETDRPVARYLSTAGAEKSRAVPAGSTLVCCIGATIGKTDIARMDCTFNQQINAVEWSDKISPAYGYYAVRGLRPEIERMGRGASTTLPILKKSLFQELRIPLADQIDQVEFESRIKAIEKHKELCTSSSICAENLFSSLQSRAFRGEL